MNNAWPDHAVDLVTQEESEKNSVIAGTYDRLAEEHLRTFTHFLGIQSPTSVLYLSSVSLHGPWSYEQSVVLCRMFIINWYRLVNRCKETRRRTGNRKIRVRRLPSFPLNRPGSETRGRKVSKLFGKFEKFRRRVEMKKIETFHRTFAFHYWNLHFEDNV